MVLTSTRFAVALLVIVGAAEVASAQRARSRLVPPAPRERFGPMTSPRPLMYGFALECTDCARKAGRPLPVWEYHELPWVRAIAEGGPAERAGITVGDTLVAVDGVSILSSDGARRLSLVAPGDRVALTFRRGGKDIVRNLVVGVPRPFAVAGGEYRASVGTTPVVISSTAPITASTDSAGVLVITTPSGLIRIRRP